MTLLGDAAHPMKPNIGQGAAQALEDAVVLGICTTEKGEPDEILREYELRRIQRANAGVRASLAEPDAPPRLGLGPLHAYATH